eukprot:TRINITY_DN33407_c0_g1_i1.p2 TRINITY_DN33407_c0_g1~~TRINITY_DN33407_c0_g1_i1.p2  ORF type:complete len:115 (+),score=11.68 TRINITY_DN33407_c0_g1_i1:106-450(+)
MIRRPPRSTLSSSSAASDVYKRQVRSCGGASTTLTPPHPSRKVLLNERKCTIGDISSNFSPVHRNKNELSTLVTFDSGLTSSVVKPEQPERKNPCTSETWERGVRSRAVILRHP